MWTAAQNAASTIFPVPVNQSFNLPPAGSKTIGSIADEKHDTLYWLVAGPKMDASDVCGLVSNITFPPAPNPGVLTNPIYAADMILRKAPTHCEPVFVDNHALIVSNQDPNGTISNSADDNTIVFSNPDWLDQIQPGMTVSGVACNDGTVPCTLTPTATVTSIGSLNEITVPIEYIVTNNPVVAPNVGWAYLETIPPDCTAPCTGCQPPLNQPQAVSPWIYLSTDLFSAATAPQVGDRVWTNSFPGSPNGLFSDGSGTNPNATFITQIQTVNVCDDGGVCTTFKRIKVSNPIVLNPNSANPTPLTLNRDCNSFHIDHSSCNNCCDCAYWGQTPQAGWGADNNGNIQQNSIVFNWESTIPNITITNTIQIPTANSWLNELNNTFWDFTQTPIVAVPNFTSIVSIDPNSHYPVMIAAVGSSDACLIPSQTAPYGPAIPGDPTNTFFDVVYCGSQVAYPPQNLNINNVVDSFTLQANFAASTVFLDQNLNLIPPVNHPGYCFLYFQGDKVLKFDQNKPITGLNIFDDMLTWVDGTDPNGTEPKKINISRSVQGTLATGTVHTRLINESLNYNYNNITGPVFGTNQVRIKEEHITVIRKSPRKALTLKVENNRTQGLNYGGIIRTTNDQNLSLGMNHNSSIVDSSKGMVQNFSTLQPGDKVRVLIPESETLVNYPGTTPPPWNPASNMQREHFNLTDWAPGKTVVLKEFIVDANNPQGVQPTVPFNYRIKARIADWKWNSFSSDRPNWGLQPPAVMNSVITSPYSIGTALGSGLIFGTGLTNTTYGDGTHTASKNTALVELDIIDIDGVPPNNPSSAAITYLDYLITLEDEDEGVFKYKLPRFSYRYRYEDGEYSAIAPWTQVAFLPSNFDYHPTEGYNLGMVNNARKIVLENFITQDMPEDVVAIDILYKEDISPSIYVVDTIEPVDPSKNFTIGQSRFFTNNWNLNSFEITKDTIKSILPENQSLRHWDNVPLKAQSQEITANRVVYGNYIQNFDLTAGFQTNVSGKSLKYSPNFTLALNKKSVSGIALGSAITSIKSLREYQLGVVFVDKYGRETPVVSNTSGTIEVKKIDAVNANQFKVGFKDTFPPPGLKFFKFFIKETAGEYYNLAMGRWYDAEDGNVWLTFPSSDRNKIDIDSYLILKKGPDSNNLVKDEARYKVLAIENEAPDWVKTKQILIDEIVNLSGTITIFQGGTLANGEVPANGNNKIKLNLLRFGTSTAANLDKINTSSTKEGSLYIQFGKTTVDGKSKRYRISEITKIDPTNQGIDVFDSNNPATHYAVTIDGQFGSDTDFLQTNGEIDDNATVLIYHYKPENDPQFDGRFWAKIKADGIFREHVIKSFDKDNVDYSTAFQQRVYYISPNIRADHSYESSGMAAGTIGAHFNSTAGAVVGSFGLDTHFTNQGPASIDTGLGGGYSYWSVDPWQPSTPTEKINTWMYNIYYGYDHSWIYNPTSVTGSSSIASDIGKFRYLSATDPSVTDEDSDDVSIPVEHEHYWTIDESTAIGRNNMASDINTLYMGPFSEDGEYLDVNSVLIQGGVLGPGPLSPYVSTSWSTQFGIQTTGSKSTIDLTFGGILPNGGEFEDSPGSGSPYFIPNEGFWDLHNNSSHQDTVTQNFLNRIYPATQWGWKQDLSLKEVHEIDSGIIEFNLLRYSDRGRDRSTASGGSFRTMYQHPANFAKNFKFNTKNPIGFDPTTGGGGGAFGPLPFVVAGSAQVDLTSVAPTIANHTVGTTAYPHNLTNLAVYTTGIEDITGNTHSITDDGTWGLVAGNGTVLNTQMAVVQGNTQDCFIVKKITPDTPATGIFEIQLAGYRRVLDPVDDLPVGVTNLITGTLTFFQLKMNGLSPRSAQYLSTIYDCPDCVRAVGYDIEIKEPIIPVEILAENPAIWETEPKDTTDLEIYHEVSDYNGLVLGPDTIKTVLPVGSIVEESNNSDLVQPGTVITNNTSSAAGNIITLNNPVCGSPAPFIAVSGYCLSIGSPANQVFTAVSNRLKITRPNGSKIIVEVNPTWSTVPGTGDNGNIMINTNLYTSAEYILDYHNCYSFLNGVESNRVRDGYNLSFIGNGVKASSTLDSKYEQEHRKYGLIYSGIYNSKSGINNLNQFIMAEKITKDVNPNYGSIQHLHARDTDLVTLCEDKVLRILANKDAVFNADGNTNLTATENVLGQTIPFVGEYGISKDATSFASESYRAYFTDTTRGAVMRLSKDGLTPISDHGMRDWFRDNLKLSTITPIGSYDDRKNEYNVTLKTPNVWYTVTFKENSKGWVSFKSFIPEEGRSCANVYYTWDQGRLWEHHSDRSPRTNFYNNQYQSRFTMVFNESPGSVKNFKTVNYEGSNSRIREFKTSTVTDWLGNTVVYNDDRYDNVREVDGWWVQKIRTDLQDGWVPEFINKEGKWFNYIKGPDYLDSARPQFDEFAAQGQGGFESFNPNVDIDGCTDQNARNFDPLAFTACKDVNGVVNGTAFANGVSFNAATDCCDPCIFGCMDQNSNNYNPNANCDDGSCFIAGCTNPTASNYNPAATIDDGSCIAPICGCVDNLMVLGENASGGLGGGPTGIMVNYYINYDNTATCDCAPSCECDQSVAGWPDTTCCIPAMYGCMDSTAWNYSTIYNIQSNEPCTSYIDSNGLLQWNGQHCDCLDTHYGCTDSTAINYDPAATVMCDGSVMGCIGNCGGPGNNECCKYAGNPPSWDCVNNQCIDPGTGNGQYGDINDCIAQCPLPPVTPSWDCVITQQAPNGVCQDPGNGLGVYSTLATCQAVPCPSNPANMPSWDCSTGACIDPGNGTGIFQTLAACQTALTAGTTNSCANKIDTGVYAPQVITPFGSANHQLFNWLITNAPGGPNNNYYAESAVLGQSGVATLCLGPNNGAYQHLNDMHVGLISNATTTVFTANSWNSLVNWGNSNGCPQLATATDFVTANTILNNCNSDWALSLSGQSCQCTGCSPSAGPTPSFNCVNGACIDPGTGLGTYPDLASCQNNCLPGPTVSYDCVGGNCVDPGTGLGVHATLAACQTNCVPSPSFDCVSGQCIDPGTGLGTYSSLGICQALCTTPPTWSCNTANGNCFDPGTGSGQYQTLATCQASCAPPPASTPSYNCVGAVCIDPGDGSGTYLDLMTCQASCPIPSFDCAKFTTNTGICTDPGDGSGAYATSALCESSNNFLNTCEDQFTGMANNGQQTQWPAIHTGIVAPNSFAPQVDAQGNIVGPGFQTYMMQNHPTANLANYLYTSTLSPSQNPHQEACPATGNAWSGPYGYTVAGLSLNISKTTGPYLHIAFNWQSMIDWVSQNGCESVLTGVDPTGNFGPAISNANAFANFVKDCHFNNFGLPGDYWTEMHAMSTKGKQCKCSGCSPPIPPGVGISFNCDSLGNCVNPGDGSGTYPTWQTCLANCIPKPPATGYKCDVATNTCIPVGGGTYPTLAACQAAGCAPPCQPGVDC